MLLRIINKSFPSFSFFKEKRNKTKFFWTEANEACLRQASSPRSLQRRLLSKIFDVQKNEVFLEGTGAFG
jgi:hypothetical protein